MAEAYNLQTPYPQAQRDPHYVSTKAGPGVATQNGELLILSLTTSDATGTVSLRGRTLNHDLSTSEFGYVFTFSGTGTQSFTPITLTAGWLVGFDVSIDSGTITDGEVVASVHIGRNAGALQQKIICLASGEITNIRALGMGAYLIRSPSAVTITPYEVPMTVATGANPAAGAQFSFTVATGKVWKLWSVKAAFSTDATVANRVAYLILDDGATEFLRVPAVQTQTASGTSIYSWMNTGFYTNMAGSLTVAPAPFPLILSAGFRVTSAVLNGVAGDDWAAPVYAYQEYTA